MRYYTNDSRPSKDEILTEDDIQRKISQIKMNRERRKQGLDYLNFETQEKTKDEESNEESEEGGEAKQTTLQPPSAPKMSRKATNTEKSGYAYYQSQIQNKMALFQAEKFSQIADAARKEKHIIYQFPDNPEPPKLGEKKNTKSSLVPIDVYYNELPNEIHYELDALRAQVADLQYIKSLQTPSVDSDGHMTPAVLTENDPDRTGVSDKVFAKISEEIDKVNKKIAAKMALWMYGIPADLLPKLETNSLSNALEAGLYREMYGIVNTSKNSAIS
jgi:hypothetical protein